MPGKPESSRIVENIKGYLTLLVSVLFFAAISWEVKHANFNNPSFSAMQKDFKVIGPFPGSAQINYREKLQPGVESVMAEFKAPASDAEIRSYYQKRFAEQGWKLINAHSGHYGNSLKYSKGDIFGDIELSGPSTANTEYQLWIHWSGGYN